MKRTNGVGIDAPITPHATQGAGGYADDSVSRSLNDAKKEMLVRKLEDEMMGRCNLCGEKICDCSYSFVGDRKRSSLCDFCSKPCSSNVCSSCIRKMSTRTKIMCARCATLKPNVLFAENASGKGRSSTCKSCVTITHKRRKN